MDKKQAFETCQANLNKKVNVKTVHGNLNGYLQNVDNNNMYLAVSGRELFGSPSGYRSSDNTRKKSSANLSGYPGAGLPPTAGVAGQPGYSPYGASPYAYKGRCGYPPKYPYPYRPYPGGPGPGAFPTAVSPAAIGPAAPITPVPVPIGGVPCGVPGGYGGYGGYGGGWWWVAVPLAFLVGLGIGWWAR